MTSAAIHAQSKSLLQSTHLDILLSPESILLGDSSVPGNNYLKPVSRIYDRLAAKRTTDEEMFTARELTGAKEMRSHELDQEKDSKKRFYDRRQIKRRKLG